MIDVVSAFGIFEGPQDKVLFTYNLSALEEGKYRTAGMLIAWSVLHNGPGIRALHPALFQIMCRQNADLQHFDYGDLPNEKVQSNLQRVFTFLCIQSAVLFFTNLVNISSSKYKHSKYYIIRTYVIQQMVINISRGIPNTVLVFFC